MLSNNRISIVLLVFIGGNFAGVNTYKPTKDVLESVIPVAPRRALPPIKWNGVCPQKASKCPQSFQESTPLILISLDGFHPEYLTRGFSPTLNKIAQCGTNAEFLNSVFPSKTFPNHFSIVTGLYPPSHGVVDNNMYDTSIGKMFRVGASDMNDAHWYQKDPLWVTAVHQGKKSASFFWPASEAKINDTFPTYFAKYIPNITFDMRVDQVLEWLDMPVSTRPKFITFYVNQPDNAGHWFGTKSKEVNQAVTNVDNMINRLYAGLQARNLVDCVDVIILSDHGMADIDCKELVDIQNYMNASQVFSIMGPFGRLQPKGKRSTVVNEEIINKLKCKSERMRVYAKEQLPVRMHYADNDRIEPIILDMDNGWTVVSEDIVPGDEICTGGSHGYDNLFPEMRAIFMAQGPSFKQNFTTKPFINTEIYEMLSELIGVVPNPNNGTRGSLHHILKSPKPLPQQIEPEPPATGYVPSDDLEYNYRVMAANCSCSQTKKQSYVGDNMEKSKKHAPFGIPYNAVDNHTTLLLHNIDYLLAFDLKYRIPTWTAFTINGKNDASKIEDICWTADARISSNNAANCGDYKKPAVTQQYILQRPLFPSGFSDPSLKEQAMYITNSIPKSMNHSKILENKLNQILGKWAAKDGQLNVMMGPAFDLHGTQLKPEAGTMLKRSETFGRLAVPTHIFVITTWCSVKVNSLQDCSTSKLMSQAFLLPNAPYPQNCEAGETVIQKNVARVVDIEKLTGISFYTGLPIYDAIRLRTMMPSRSVL